MPFSPAFTVSQAINPKAFSLTDTSTGVDAAITQRRIYLNTASNTTLVPTGTTTSYINFPLTSGNSITLNVLNVDYALSIMVQWLNVSGAVLYTLTQYYCFTANDNDFLFSLTTMQTSEPNIIGNTNYFQNKLLLFLYVNSAENAVTQGNDIYKAQFCLDQAQNLINNSQFFFT